MGSVFYIANLYFEAGTKRTSRDIPQGRETQRERTDISIRSPHFDGQYPCRSLLCHHYSIGLKATIVKLSARVALFLALSSAISAFFFQSFVHSGIFSERSGIFPALIATLWRK